MYDFENFETDLLFEQLSENDHEDIVIEEAIDGHKNPKSYLIGSISFNNSINEQEVGGKRFKAKSIGECKVEVYSGEGTIPHGHVYNKDKSFNSCICIYSNEYFAHGGKYNSKFTSKQSKEFNEWMKSTNTDSPFGFTNWMVCATLWNVSNKNSKFPKERMVSTQPDYSKLPIK